MAAPFYFWIDKLIDETKDGKLCLAYWTFFCGSMAQRPFNSFSGEVLVADGHRKVQFSCGLSFGYNAYCGQTLLTECAPSDIVFPFLLTNDLQTKVLCVGTASIKPSKDCRRTFNEDAFEAWYPVTGENWFGGIRPVAASDHKNIRVLAFSRDGEVSIAEGQEMRFCWGEVVGTLGHVS